MRRPHRHSKGAGKADRDDYNPKPVRKSDKDREKRKRPVVFDGEDPRRVPFREGEKDYDQNPRPPRPFRA